MREDDFISKNCSRETPSCKYLSEHELLEQLKHGSMDIRSIDIMRKLAFLRLVDASKKHHMQKMQGKDSAALEKTGKAVSELYSDYNRVKNWTQSG